MKQGATGRNGGGDGDGARLHVTTVHNSGRTQSVELPDDCRFGTAKVYVRKMGNAVLLIPEDDPWASLLDSLNRFSDDYMSERGAPLARAGSNCDSPSLGNECQP